MKKELKAAIISYILENEKEFQIINKTTDKFKNYIYDTAGEYLIGGKDVRDFIKNAITLLTN